MDMTMGILNHLQQLLKSKISVTIIYPPTPGVEHTTIPRVVEKDEPIVNKVRRSDYRFVSETKTDYEGNAKTYYMTERFEKQKWGEGRWCHVSESFNADRNKAMELHLLLLERGNLEPVCERIVHWEGLSKEEATTWVALSKTGETANE
jgi:hypothetical protein